jgi:hypothetical protein
LMARIHVYNTVMKWFIKCEICKWSCFCLQDILFIKQNVSLLNGSVARMTALISVIFAELTIIGMHLWLFRDTCTSKLFYPSSINLFVNKIADENQSSIEEYILFWILMAVCLLHLCKAHSHMTLFQRLPEKD